MRKGAAAAQSRQRTRREREKAIVSDAILGETWQVAGIRTCPLSGVFAYRFPSATMRATALLRCLADTASPPPGVVDHMYSVRCVVWTVV